MNWLAAMLSKMEVKKKRSLFTVAACVLFYAQMDGTRNANAVSCFPFVEELKLFIK